MGGRGPCLGGIGGGARLELVNLAAHLLLHLVVVLSELVVFLFDLLVVLNALLLVVVAAPTLALFNLPLEFEYLALQLLILV